MADKVAVQLLVGQNEEPFLPYAIRSVLWADSFAVVNTDPLSEWGKVNAAIVHAEIPEEKLRYDEIIPEDNGHFSFAEARNKSLEMTDIDDFVLILDSDDVHFPEWEQIVRDGIRMYDSITAHFYHLMVYKNIYQYTQPREIVYQNYKGTHWSRGVHEQLVNRKQRPTTTHYHYMHYGYVKPQKDVFSRWKFYSDLDGDFDHYNGQNPDTILDDRVKVCQELPVAHPPVIQEFISTFPDSPSGAVRPSGERRAGHAEEKVGLVVLTVNDEPLLDTMFEGLLETVKPPDFTLLAIDCNSTDGSLTKLQEWQGKVNFEMEIVATNVYTSLAETLNYGFDHFRIDDSYSYVGWIHPDMEFMQPEWLHYLWLDLAENPKIGKICSSNFRDFPIPDQLTSGHEQCYIMRKDILHKIGLFDEGYIGIGGYEDWDLNRRIKMHQGPEGFYEVMISPRSTCFHHGMATRSRRDTRDEQIANARYYFEKWGTYSAPC